MKSQSDGYEYPVDVAIRRMQILVLTTSPTGKPARRENRRPLQLSGTLVAGDGPHYVPIPRDRSTHASTVARPEAGGGSELWNRRACCR